MTQHDELLARLDALSLEAPHVLTASSTTCKDAATAIRELAAQLEERETAAKKWHLQCNNAMEMFEAERRERTWAERYKTAWIEWRSLQTGDVQKLLDAAMRATAAEASCLRLESALGAAHDELQKDVQPCCQEWNTCTRRCSPLAENWRMAAKAAEALRLEAELAGMEWCANECADNEDAADDVGNRQAAKAHALDAEMIRAEIARRRAK